MISVFVLAAFRSALAEPPVITRDVSYGERDQINLTFDACRPKTPNHAAVLFIVSSGWNSDRFDPKYLFRDRRSAQQPSLFTRLVDAGYTIFVVRHRSAPTFKVPDAVDDVRLAVRFLRSHAPEYAVDPTRFGALGSSAGGHLALMLGTTAGSPPADAAELSETSDRVQAVVAHFPPTDIRPLFIFRHQEATKWFPALDFEAALAESVSPLAHVSADDAPTLFVHGTHDRLVPILSSTAMKVALEQKHVPTDLVSITGAGHGFRGDDAKRASEATLAWFEEHLREPSR